MLRTIQKLTILMLLSVCSIALSLNALADVTVQTCWDADRLDLGRVGTTPKAEYLCTDAGKDPDMIEWAHGRAVK